MGSSDLLLRSQVKNMGGIGAHCMEDFRTLQMFVEAPSLYKDRGLRCAWRAARAPRKGPGQALQLLDAIRDDASSLSNSTLKHLYIHNTSQTCKARAYIHFTAIKGQTRGHICVRVTYVHNFHLYNLMVYHAALPSRPGSAY